jgi:putative ABC transport system ATP-binding protein
MQLIREVAVQKDRAVIVVTHDSRVFHFGDRIIHMDDGRVDRVETNHSPRSEEGRGVNHV